MTVRLTNETAAEVEKMAGEMAMSVGQLAGLCVTFGMEALKLAMNPASSSVMASISERVNKAVDEVQKEKTPKE